MEGTWQGRIGNGSRGGPFRLNSWMHPCIVCSTCTKRAYFQPLSHCTHRTYANSPKLGSLLPSQCIQYILYGWILKTVSVWYVLWEPLFHLAFHSNYGFVHVFSFFVFSLSVQIKSFFEVSVLTNLVQFQYFNVYLNALHNLYTFLFVARRFAQSIWYYHFFKYRQKLCIQWTDFSSLRLIAVIHKSWLVIGTLLLNNFLTNAAAVECHFSC